MKLPSTYEFAQSGSPRWIIAHSRKAACDHAAASGWCGRGSRKYGPFWTGLLLTADEVDAVLDRNGALIAPSNFGAIR